MNDARRPMIWIMAVLLAAAPGVSAQPPFDAPDDRVEVSWRCWYDEERGPALACRLLLAPALGEPAPPGANPPLLGRIRGQPGTLDDQIVLIPLFGPPVEMARAERLARAVMCGGVAGCTVDFVRGPRT